jgi:hypothetical protein
MRFDFPGITAWMAWTSRCGFWTWAFRKNNNFNQETSTISGNLIRGGKEGESAISS